MCCVEFAGSGPGVIFRRSEMVSMQPDHVTVFRDVRVFVSRAGRVGDPAQVVVRGPVI